MRLLVIIVVACLCLLCSTPPKAITESSSILAYNIQSSGILSGSSPCSVYVVNLRSNVEYRTGYFKKGFGYIFNIPEGEYRISKMRVPFSNGYFRADNLSSSKQFTVQGHGISYLGCHRIRVRVRTPIARLELKRDRASELQQTNILQQSDFLSKYGLRVNNAIPDVFVADSVYDLLGRE